MDKNDPYWHLTKGYVQLRDAMVLARGTLTNHSQALTPPQEKELRELLAKTEEGIAQLKQNYPDVDFEVLATALQYWDPELEERFPEITDWSVLSD